MKNTSDLNEKKNVQNNYTVYMHVSPSGKKYVGITGDSPKNRWDSGHGYRRNPHFWNAIQKYGWNNFEHLILYTDLTKDEAKEYEIKLIKEYNLTNKKYGYNVSEGGDLGVASNRKPIYMYDSLTGDFIKRFNSCNEAERYLGKSGSNTIGKFCEENNYHTLYGYLWRWTYSPNIEIMNRDFIILLYDALTLKPINAYKKLEHDIIYKDIKLKRSAIVAHCNSKKYLYKNVFCCYCKDAMDLMINYLSGNNHIKIIYQIDKDTNKIINIYSSYSEAGRENGILDNEISKACRGINKTSGGYKWESIGFTKGEDIEAKINFISKTYFVDDNNCEE